MLEKNSFLNEFDRLLAWLGLFAGVIAVIGLGVSIWFTTIGLTGLVIDVVLASYLLISFYDVIVRKGKLKAYERVLLTIFAAYVLITFLIGFIAGYLS